MRYICSHLSCSYRIASVSGSLLPRTARRQDTTDELMLSARFPIFIETGRHCTFGFENYMVLSMSVMLFCGVTNYNTRALRSTKTHAFTVPPSIVVTDPCVWHVELRLGSMCQLISLRGDEKSVAADGTKVTGHDFPPRRTFGRGRILRECAL